MFESSSQFVADTQHFRDQYIKIFPATAVIGVAYAQDIFAYNRCAR